MVDIKLAYAPKNVSIIGIVLIIVGFAADIVSKIFVTSLNVNKEIIPGIFKLSLVKNTGLAFSFLKAYPYAALAINIIMFVILVIIWKRMNLTFLAISIGGAFGNLIERLIFGGVTDFISVLNFPVFNIGDVLIFTGITLTILFNHNAMTVQPLQPNQKNIIVKK